MFTTENKKYIKCLNRINVTFYENSWQLLVNSSNKKLEKRGENIEFLTSKDWQRFTDLQRFYVSKLWNNFIIMVLKVKL